MQCFKMGMSPWESSWTSTRAAWWFEYLIAEPSHESTRCLPFTTHMTIQLTLTGKFDFPAWFDLLRHFK